MNKQRILIVDENAMIAKMVGIWLERTGVYETRRETKPLLAASTARCFKPDLVLLDADMPEMNGRKVADAIWRDPFLEYTPILFLTAAMKEHAAEARKLGQEGSRFIPKPVSPAELIDHVTLALAESHEAVCG